MAYSYLRRECLEASVLSTARFGLLQFRDGSGRGETERIGLRSYVFRLLFVQPPAQLRGPANFLQCDFWPASSRGPSWSIRSDSPKFWAQLFGHAAIPFQFELVSIRAVYEKAIFHQQS